MDDLIRKALTEDLPRIQQIYDHARGFMAATGNPDQWGKTHPPASQLEEDIALGELYVLQREGALHGVFFFRVGPDPTYARVEGGNWRREGPYGVIHRIASDGSGGVLRSAVTFALKACPYLRIDTHHDNRVMHKALGKLGFSRRGVIYLADGSPRIAYDLLP